VQKPTAPKQLATRKQILLPATLTLYWTPQQMWDRCRNPLHHLNYKPSNWKQQTDYKNSKTNNWSHNPSTQKKITMTKDQV